jgi:hypothetical protein
MKKLIIVLLFPIFCYSQNIETTTYNIWDNDIQSNYCCEKCKTGEHKFVQSDTIQLDLFEHNILDNIFRNVDTDRTRTISVKSYKILSICRICCQEHIKNNVVIERRCNTLYDVMKNKSDDIRLNSKLFYFVIKKEYSINIRELK